MPKMSSERESVSRLIKKRQQQRRHRRYSYDAPAMICRPRGPSRAGWIHNLSEGGMMVELAEPLPAGTPLDVIISLDGKSICTEAKVIWSHNSDHKPYSPHDHGLKFTSIKAWDKLQLKHFIAQALQR